MENDQDYDCKTPPELLQDIGIPRHFWKYDYSTFPGDTEKVERSLGEADFDKWIMFYGPQFSGKTFWLTYVLRSQAQLGNLCRYQTAMTVTDSYFAKNRTSDLKSMFMVGVDNLNESPNNGTVSAVEHLLQMLSDEDTLFVGATSLTPETFGAEYGERSANILKQRCVWVECDDLTFEIGKGN